MPPMVRAHSYQLYVNRESARTVNLTAKGGEPDRIGAAISK